MIQRAFQLKFVSYTRVFRTFGGRGPNLKNNNSSGPQEKFLLFITGQNTKRSFEFFLNLTSDFFSLYFRSWNIKQSFKITFSLQNFQFYGSKVLPFNGPHLVKSKNTLAGYTFALHGPQFSDKKVFNQNKAGWNERYAYK